MSSPPYPTPPQISAIFAKCSTDEEIAKLRHLFAPDCDGHVTGQEHHLGGSRSTGEDWVLHLETMNAIYDKSTFAVEIVHVFGGGEEPWVCMEAVVSAKTLEGKDYRNEFVWVMRFNTEGKIDKIRAYYDTAHTEAAIAPEMKKAALQQQDK
ncbi:MAG: hypothetical protein Q9195_000581 [Heterodermia aff. obscurata]